MTMSENAIKRSVEVPAYSGASIDMSAGEIVRLVDIEGCQVGDLFAVVKGDAGEFLSPSVTRLNNGNIFPVIGQSFFTTGDRPILTFVEDTSPGQHDMLYASCNDAWYRSRGMADHPNCRDNYFAAARAAGIDHAIQPDPVNIFQNTPPKPDGSFFVGVTLSRPGDYVALRAELDCTVIVTACSSERILGGKSTPMRLEIYAS
jgi:uncharacterized protein YcgI (DUF1989 family)